MNILLLTGKFGMGHWSASQSLRQQLLHNFPDATVEVEDFLTYAMPNFAETMYKGFNLVVTHGSPLFNVYYKLTSLNHPDARPPFEGLLLDKLTELLHQRRPDAVIATHPLCAQLVSRLKGEYQLDLPLITCVTDVSSHPEWINQNTDCYMVPSKEVRRALAQKGVDPALVCVTGIPVREEFRSLSHDEMSRDGMSHDGMSHDGMSHDGMSHDGTGNTEQGAEDAVSCGNRKSLAVEQSAEGRPGEVRLKRKDGRNAENTEISDAHCSGTQNGHPGSGKRKELLIMGGGLGMLPKSPDFYDALNAIPDTHTTIITGRNKKLCERLQGRWENVEVIGYTSQVWEYMSRADLIVTKPGGITLFETISAQVPILTWPPSLCQEQGNARWLEEEGIGWVAEKKNCAWEIRDLLMDSNRLSRAQLRMKHLKEQMKAESLNGLMEVIAGEK